MSERWNEGPPDGALRRERESVSERTNGVPEPSKAATPAVPGEGAMYGPTADQPEPDKAPDEAPALADPEKAGPDTEVGRFEERLRRLEDALAQLQDLKGIETRVASQIQSEPRGDPPSTGLSAGALWDTGKKLLASAGAAARPARTEPERAAHQGTMGFLREMFVEVRAMAYMFVDPRYRMSWWGRGSALVLLALFLFSYWLPLGTSIYVVGYWINKLIDLVLAYFLFKTLAREARRYRELAPDLPPQLR
jgi:hypothetical protein